MVNFSYLQEKDLLTNKKTRKLYEITHIVWWSVDWSIEWSIEWSIARRVLKGKGGHSSQHSMESMLLSTLYAILSS